MWVLKLELTWVRILILPLAAMQLSANYVNTLCFGFLI